MQSDSLHSVLSVFADAIQYLGVFGAAAAAQLRGWFQRRVSNSPFVTTNSKLSIIKSSGFLLFFPMFVYTEAQLPHFHPACSALRSFWSSASV